MHFIPNLTNLKLHKLTIQNQFVETITSKTVTC